ncbi:MAG: 30S ribosomal protein S12 methylthiotransferase RimO [Deltaproteobacteria bacterium]|jgi:ribosomal protein S12 methylthiotransferase|nr:30S ribosomal protein S12 methylthiotransferase RimO [Deltaproteobacteria bacterium]
MKNDSGPTLGLLVHLVSLGCSKNLVDSERLMAAAQSLGFKPTLVPEEADLLVVNTCAFIQSATEEAISAIMDLASRKKPGACLAVAGCLISRYGAELSRILPEADLVMAPKDYEGFLAKLAARFGSLPRIEPGPFETWTRFPGTPPWRSWLKIAEGCNNKCSYCLIPSLRGSLKVRSLSELVKEAEILVKAGVLELTLVAQDLTAWSEGDLGLDDLVRALAEIDELIWIRLMYAYPERINEKLARSLASIPKLVPYLDIPVQHASPAILKAMGRPAKNPLPLINNLRDWWPEVALRTTLMVGFPGETEEDFDLLVRFLESAAFDQAGVFKFSPEEGARASSLPNQLPKVVKEKRRRNLMSRQRKISLARNRARIGQKKLVLVEGPSADSDLVMTGRADFQAPEVDGLIFFDGFQPIPGQMVKVRLIKAGPYDLVAGLDLES